MSEPFFFGCYLLSSQAAASNGYTYIGFTVNPPRRLRQHNGHLQGGALRTRRFRPWEMALLVHGFPNKLVSLQFEWAWQNPHLSRHFKAAGSAYAHRHRSHFMLAHKARVLVEMLRMPCWARLALRVTFLAPKYERMFRALFDAPGAVLAHIVVATQTMDQMPYFFSGKDDDEEDEEDEEEDDNDDNDVNASDDRDPDTTTPPSQHDPFHAVSSTPGPSSQHDDATITFDPVLDWILNSPGASAAAASRTVIARPSRCYVCRRPISIEDADEALMCSEDGCAMISHMLCLARVFLDNDAQGQTMLLPCLGPCPCCTQTIVWGNLVRDLQIRRKQRQLELERQQPQGRKLSSQRRRLDDKFEQDYNEMLGAQENDKRKATKKKKKKQVTADFDLFDLSNC